MENHHVAGNNCPVFVMFVTCQTLYSVRLSFRGLVSTVAVGYYISRYAIDSHVHLMLVKLCFSSSETCQQTHPETCEYGAVFHHSPRSALEALPCISSMELNSSSHAASPSSVPSSLRLAPENRSPHRIVGKEIPNLCIRS